MTNKTTTNTYFEIDSRRSSFNIDTFDDYEADFIIKARFHNEVPEDIKNDYETVEYLMAHAYYHYQMYDDALNRLLGIYEMAIKLRAQELGINLKLLPNKKGFIGSKSLSGLTKEVLESEQFERYQFFLDNVRGLRNYMKHPDQHTVMGQFGKQHVIPILNFINKLFLPTERKHDTEKELLRINNVLNNYSGKLFRVPDIEGDYRLAFTPKITDCYFKGDEWIYLMHFEAVLGNAFELLSQHKTGGLKPFIYPVRIDDLSIQRFDVTIIDRNDKLMLSKGEGLVANQKAYDLFMEDLRKCKRIDLMMYHNRLRTELFEKREKFMYELAWG